MIRPIFASGTLTNTSSPEANSTIELGVADAESDAAAPVCAALEAAAGWIADPANEQAGAQLLTERMNVPADKANQVWASQKTLWPVEISADRWTQNVAWVNNQTSGKSDADVPFDPLC